MTLTSTTHPLRVDWLPLHAAPLPGEIGLTFAPGKTHAGLAGNWLRDLGSDLDRLRDTYRARVLVCLLEDHELRSLGIPTLLEEARRRHIDVLRLTIADGGVPQRMADLVNLVGEIVTRAARGENVVIHCRGGLGRTGLVGACVLVALGSSPPDAVRTVRHTRPGSVETDEQEAWVEKLASAWPPDEALQARVQERRALLSRFRGCLLGGALGDALGYPVEFVQSAGAIHERLGAPTSSAFPFPAPAKVSDDTQMTLFVAEGVLRGWQRLRDRGICSMPAVQKMAMLRWLSTQGERVPEHVLDGWVVEVKELHARRAPGNTCLSALRTLTADETRHPLPGEGLNDSKGCGAVMRSAPIGLAAGDRASAFELGRDAGVLTHGHASGYLSAAYFAAVVHDVSRGMSLDAAMREADALLARELGCEELAAIVARVRALRGRVPSVEDIERLGGGWTGEEALGIGLACALGAE
ncbi:MAG TPA: ADP-ribosylglycohydrolase family protein, partial [Polyangiaceae bacterium]|nr:ADP-ribosylglycohydrolase family protein [Polyangiaceae bacterium]